MENLRGICTSCGDIVIPSGHQCSDTIARLMAIDREAGPRAVRESLLALGQKGFEDKIELLEAEAAVLRVSLLE